LLFSGNITSTGQKISKGPGAPVFVEGGRLCHGTVAQWPVQACYGPVVPILTVPAPPFPGSAIPRAGHWG